MLPTPKTTAWSVTRPRPSNASCASLPSWSWSLFPTSEVGLDGVAVGEGEGFGLIVEGPRRGEERHPVAAEAEDVESRACPRRIYERSTHDDQLERGRRRGCLEENDVCVFFIFENGVTRRTI
jgi:hypothetical protein